MEKQKEKVVILMPMRGDGNIHIDTAKFCADAKINGHKWKVLAALEPNIARNMLTLQALHDEEYEDCTHVLYLDADTSPSEGDLEKLLAHNKDVVCGVVPIMKGKAVWNVAIEDEFIDTLPAELFEIKKTGGACMLIKREVFTGLGAPLFKIDYSAPTITMLVNSKTQKLGGDLYFCNRLREHGFQIWADPVVKCGHSQTVNLGNLIN